MGSANDIPCTIPPRPGVLSAAIELLAHVEDLPPDATGALRFGSQGMVLVESRLVCWANALGMDDRLTAWLRDQRKPPLDQAALERLFHECRDTDIPIGEALVSRGQVTEEGLRSALFRQTTEAIAQIAHSHAPCEGFTPHRRSKYDARFVFPTPDILAALGGRRHRALAAAARAELQGVLGPDAAGLAFVRDGDEARPVVVSAEGCAGRRVSELVEVGIWVLGVFDVASRLDPGVSVVAADRGAAASIVAWRTKETHFAALCATRPASALLFSRVLARLGAGGRSSR